MNAPDISAASNRAFAPISISADVSPLLVGVILQWSKSHEAPVVLLGTMYSVALGWSLRSHGATGLVGEGIRLVCLLSLVLNL